MRTRLLCTSLLFGALLAGCGEQTVTTDRPPTPTQTTPTRQAPLAALDLTFSAGKSTIKRLRCPEQGASVCAQYTREVIVAQLFPVAEADRSRARVDIVRRPVTVTGSAYGKPVKLSYPRRGQASQQLRYALLRARFPFLPKPVSTPKNINITKSTGRARTSPDPSVKKITRAPAPPPTKPAQPGAQPTTTAPTLKPTP